MSVRKKLNIGFISLICLLLILSILSFLQFKVAKRDIEEALNHRIVQMQLTEKIQQQIASQGLFLRSYILNSKDETAKANLERYEKLLPETIQELTSIVRSDYTKSIMEQVSALQTDLLASSEKAIQAFTKGNTDLALSYINNDVTKYNREIFALTIELLEYHDEQLQKVEHNVDLTVSRAIIFSIVLLLVSTIVGLYFMNFVKKSIVQPLRQVINAADALAQGDLTIAQLDYSSKDEIGILATAVNTLKQNLSKLIGSVQDSATHLSAASEELSASTEEVTATSSNIAHRVKETTNHLTSSARTAEQSTIAMDETAAGVQRIAEATQYLHHNALNMTQLANTGGATILTAKEQMNTISGTTTRIAHLTKKLSKQSEDIGQITKVITAISGANQFTGIECCYRSSKSW